MKKAIHYFLLGLVLPLLTSCWSLVDPVPESDYQPILMSRAQLETSIKMLDLSLSLMQVNCTNTGTIFW